MSKELKIPAFTMVDVLTGMIITSIIIAMVFYLFTGLNKQLADYGVVRNKLNGYLLLKADLKRHFDNGGTTIEGIPGGVEVQQDSAIISYIKDGSLLLRHSENTVDTLSTTISKFEIELNKNIQEESSEKVAFLKLDVLINELELKAVFHKDYSPAETINQMLLNGF